MSAKRTDSSSGEPAANLLTRKPEVEDRKTDTSAKKVDCFSRRVLRIFAFWYPHALLDRDIPDRRAYLFGLGNTIQPMDTWSSIDCCANCAPASFKSCETNYMSGVQG